MRTHEHADIRSFELDIFVSLARAEVWKILTESTNAWWLPDFHMLGKDSTVTLDATAGGLLLESHESAGTLLWYTVHMAEPGAALYMVGHSFSQWGGPRTSMLTLTLSDTESGCKLAVHDSLIGRVTDEAVSRLRDGWTKLFGEGLKSYCEWK